MTTIQINTENKKLSVNVPYVLKDQFKLTFKTAKFNGTTKRWEVGSRTKKRLTTWVEEVNQSSLQNFLEQKEEQDLTEKELINLRNNLEYIQIDLENSIQRKVSLGQIKKDLMQTRLLLKESQEALAQAEKEEKEAQETAHEELEKIKEAISKIINLYTLQEAYAEMCKNSRNIASYARNKFVAAQHIFNEANTKLKETGLESVGMALLWELNPNRRFDRDNPSNIDFNLIFKLNKWKGGKND